MKIPRMVKFSVRKSICMARIVLIFNLFSEESDLFDVMEEVIDLSKKWRILGMALRLDSAELDSIAGKHNSDSTECLRSVLLSWLQTKYDVDRYGAPTWEILCKAIEGRAGANDPDLAKEIADRHPYISQCDTIYSNFLQCLCCPCILIMCLVHPLCGTVNCMIICICPILGYNPNCLWKGSRL